MTDLADWPWALWLLPVWLTAGALALGFLWSLAVTAKGDEWRSQ